MAVRSPGDSVTSVTEGPSDMSSTAGSDESRPGSLTAPRLEGEPAHPFWWLPASYPRHRHRWYLAIEGAL